MNSTFKFFDLISFTLGFIPVSFLFVYYLSIKSTFSSNFSKVFI